MVKKIMVKGLLFDLDGVIVDTAKYHYLAWKKLCEELNLKFDINDNELLKGVSRTRSFEIILELNNKKMSDEDISKYCEKKNNIYLEYIQKLKKEEVLPGVEEFIKNAKNNGYLIALGSASKNARLILDRLELTSLFDAIVDGTKVSKAKPDPEVFIIGSKELNLLPEECIVFEDSLAGIIAAHNGNMKAVGVGNSEVSNQCDIFIKGFVGINEEFLIRKMMGE